MCTFRLENLINQTTLRAGNAIKYVITSTSRSRTSNGNSTFSGVTSQRIVNCSTTKISGTFVSQMCDIFVNKFNDRRRTGNLVCLAGKLRYRDVYTNWLPL